VNIEEALKQHHAWLDNYGTDGKRFSEIGVNLYEADLREANLYKADLREANLREADLSGANLCRADLSRAILSKAILRGADVSFADLREADLSKANLSRINLAKTNLSRADLSEARLYHAALHKANLSGANLSDANFREANLSEANLSEANLSGANLKDADLSNANLSEANLCRADLSGSDLSNFANLSGVNLSGVNLSEANLSGADLSGANLSEADLWNANLSGANLSGADLSGANLSRVQALGTYFNCAVLTGVCIEDWNINTNTNLEKVECQAFYLRKNQTIGKYTDRRPSDENAIFSNGDFARLVRKAQDTVDLIFRNGIDWKALAISIERFKVESNGAELTIQAIENKGEDGFVIRVNVPADANKSELEKFLKQEYEFALNALEAQYRSQLEAKDREIIESYRHNSTNLSEIMKLMASRQINVVNTAISESKSVSDNISINQSGAINPNASVAKDSARIQNILHNYPAEQQKSLAEAAAEIQQLLEQLSATYPTTTIAEKSAVATKAIETIEKNPAQKAKIVKALKVGGIAALKELVEPVMKPVTNILFPMLEELTKD
jgi:uncharacterized protein YjbI with pentapeptide repeats